MEIELSGGHDEGSFLVDGTVRRSVRPWSSTVHHLLNHLESAGFAGAPRFRGIDEAGREILTYLPGETVKHSRPWPRWTHSDAALDEVGRWLSTYHRAVADYLPPVDALWREGGSWQPGLVVAHGDAAPYNAVWNEQGLVGLIDWDMAGPVPAEEDLAWVVFSWAPLHDRALVLGEGFTAFSRRRQRVERILQAYGWAGTTDDMLDLVARRVQSQIDTMRRVAMHGDPAYRSMLDRGVDRHLEAALMDLENV